MGGTFSQLVLRIGLVLPVLVGASAGYSQAADISLRDRLVTEVIAEYEDQGYRFLYSTGLVRRSLRFSGEPGQVDPIERLRAGLHSVGLTLQESPTGVWLIVRLPQETAGEQIEGRVLDADTGKPLAGVRVEIAGQVLRTDDDGRFRLPAATSGLVLVSRDGYEHKRVFRSAQVEALLEIPLAPQRPMDEIVVVSSRYAVQAKDTESHRLDLATMESIPRLGEDPLRITGHLPGMATIGVSAKPHIRGGLQDELLVLFNNLELLEPFHLRDFQSVFSSFNPSLIQSIDVYTGGFPARYGDRMSGVMDINPNREQRGGGGEVSLSLLNAGVVLYGETESGQGDWIVSARRGNLDIVTKEINSTVGEPSYSDWFAQYRYQIDPVTELDVGLIAYNDDIELSDFDTDGEVANSRYRNIYGWAQLQRFWSPRLDGTTLVYYGDIKHERDGMLIDEDLDNGLASVDDRRDFQLLALSQTFSFAATPRVHAEFGGRYTYQRGRYDYTGSIKRGVLAEFLDTALETERDYHLRPRGGSGGVFGSLRLEPWDAVLVEAGVRWDFQDYAQDFTSQFSPRLSVRFDLGDDSEVRISAGRFFQPEAIHELLVGDGITEYQDAQYADHFIVSWHQGFSESGFSLRSEVFAKNFRDSKRRFENLFNPMVLLPELASDRVEIAPSKGRARGFESTLKYAPNDRFVSWLTYTFAEVEDRVGEDWEPRSWDQGETISAGLSWQRGPWTIGATLLWHDGWRTTDLPSVIAEDEVPVLRRNQARLRDYISLDLQINRKWEWEHQSLTAFLEVTNLLSRHNVGGVEYDVDEDEEAGVFLLTSANEELLPLVPSIGLRWQF